MADLRAISTRAEITSAGFVNHYEWGDLKADPLDWMRRYFDAFVYTANWCSCRLALRVPITTFRKGELDPFGQRYALTIEATDTHWIVEWSLDEGEDHDRFAMDDGRSWMRRLVPLRDELLRGDLRPLYLGWLAAASRDELDDDALEPALGVDGQPGFSTLSPAQQALAEFLEIDPDMLAAAMTGDARSSPSEAGQTALLDAWLAQWPREEMAAVLKLIVQDQGPVAERQLRARYADWRKAQRTPSADATRRRSVGQLRELADAAGAARLEREAAEQASAEAERRLEHEAMLRQRIADVDRQWALADTHASRGTGSGYGEAVQVLKQLAEGYALTSSREDFERALKRWLARHASRPALLRRLTQAGLWSG